MGLDIEETPNLKRARKVGGSTMLPLTEFIVADRYYKVFKMDNTIMIKEAKITIED